VGVLQGVQNFLELAVGEPQVADEVVGQIASESLGDVARGVAGGAL
jgi:hypothetical protein